MLIATLITSVVFYRMFFPSPIFENVDVIWPHELFYDIDGLREDSSDIIRAQIISKYTDSISVGDTDRTIYSFIKYEIKILDVFQGSAQIGDIIGIIQYTQSRHYSLVEFNIAGGFRQQININYKPLEIGAWINFISVGITILFHYQWWQCTAWLNF